MQYFPVTTLDKSNKFIQQQQEEEEEEEEQSPKQVGVG
jgi:hypothetical protein